jgi:hypothetical protein
LRWTRSEGNRSSKRCQSSAFAALAVGYAAVAHGRADWIAAISGPLAMVAGLFLVSGLRRVA